MYLDKLCCSWSCPFGFAKWAFFNIDLHFNLHFWGQVRYEKRTVSKIFKSNLLLFFLKIIYSLTKLKAFSGCVLVLFAWVSARPKTQTSIWASKTEPTKKISKVRHRSPDFQLTNIYCDGLKCANQLHDVSGLVSIFKK